MELPSIIVKQIAYNTRPKIGEHMLIVMEKSTHEEHLSQPLQTDNKQFKIVVTFLTGYNGILNVTDKNNKFFFLKKLLQTKLVLFKSLYPKEHMNLLQ